MTKVRETIEIGAAPGEVWEMIGEPAALADWHPAIESVTVEGDTRACVLGDGARLTERITNHSNDDRRYSYEFVESPLPLTGYSSQIAVEASGDGAVIVWEGQFQPEGISEEEAIELVGGIYRAGLDAVGRQLG